MSYLFDVPDREKISDSIWKSEPIILQVRRGKHLFRIEVLVDSLSRSETEGNRLNLRFKREITSLHPVPKAIVGWKRAIATFLEEEESGKIVFGWEYSQNIDLGLYHTLDDV